MKRKEAVQLRRILDNVVSAIPAADETAFNSSAAAINENAAALRVWLAGTADKPQSYKRSDIRIDPADGVPYWAIHDHTSYAGAELQPHVTPTIWAHCHGTTPETARPFVAESYNLYMTGHYCTENGITHRCKQDMTVYPPSVYPDAWEVA